MQQAQDQNWWQVVPWGLGSVILAVVAIGVTVTIFIKTRKRKTLDYSIVSDVKILSDRVNEMRHDIVVTVGSLQIKDPRIVTVRYINTGNQEIVKDDFLAGSITTTAKSQVVNSHLVRASDEHIMTTESGVAPHKTYFADCLNPGDFLEVQYLLDMAGTTSEEPFSPVCRIMGATRPPRSIAPRLGAGDFLKLVLREFLKNLALR